MHRNLGAAEDWLKNFCASERQTRKAKKLVSKNGILTSPNLKKGKT